MTAIPIIGAKLVDVGEYEVEGTRTRLVFRFDNGEVLRLSSCECCDGISVDRATAPDPEDPPRSEVLAPWAVGIIDPQFLDPFVAGFDSAAAAERVDAKRAQRREFSDAHAEGLHDDLPRDGCPDCEERRGRVGP